MGACCFLQSLAHFGTSVGETTYQPVELAPGARVRPSTNHWVSYQPTIGHFTNQLLGVLPTDGLVLGLRFTVLVLGFGFRVLVLGFRVLAVGFVF